VSATTAQGKGEPATAQCGQMHAGETLKPQPRDFNNPRRNVAQIQTIIQGEIYEQWIFTHFEQILNSGRTN
jgi:hypothetical protein